MSEAVRWKWKDEGDGGLSRYDLCSSADDMKQKTRWGERVGDEQGGGDKLSKED